MQEFSFRTQLVLPRKRDEIFRFFADAGNLEVLTPPWLRFCVLTPPPIKMHLGTLIDYKLRVHGTALPTVADARCFGHSAFAARYAELRRFAAEKNQTVENDRESLCAAPAANLFSKTPLSGHFWTRLISLL
jgi:ligand-binding SRPBCC domain-containing protein